MIRLRDWDCQESIRRIRRVDRPHSLVGWGGRVRAVVSPNLFADSTFRMPEVFLALGLHMHQPPGNLVALHNSGGFIGRGSVLECASPLALSTTHDFRAPEDWRTPGPVGFSVALCRETGFASSPFVRTGRATAVPSPGGEGQDEGGRFIKLLCRTDISYA